MANNTHESAVLPAAWDAPKDGRSLAVLREDIATVLGADSLAIADQAFLAGRRGDIPAAVQMMGNIDIQEVGDLLGMLVCAWPDHHKAVVQEWNLVQRAAVAFQVLAFNYERGPVAPPRLVLHEQGHC